MTDPRSVLTLELVAFDEAGNTGQNLLDPDQPVFVGCSVRISNEAAQEVVAGLRDGALGEAKFSRLRSSRRGRRRILQMLSHPAITPENVRMSVYHKRFMVTTKIVDMLVEPFFHWSGIDFYKGGQNLAFANLLHMVTPTFCGAHEFEALLGRFVDMVRDRTPTNVSRYYDQVQHMRETNTHATFDQDLEMLLLSKDFVDELIKEKDLVALDPAIPTFVELAAQWSAALGVPFRIAHDRSKALEHQQLYLETLMSASEPGREFPNYGPTWRLPILATGLSFVDSSDVPQVQVADLLSGAAMTVMSASARGKLGRFEKEILATPFGQLSSNMVWPTKAITPEELEADKRPGGDSLNYLMEIANRARKSER